MKHILFATDLSEQSLLTGQKALQLAKAFGSTLTIMHAIEPLPAYGYVGIADLEGPAKVELDKLSEQLGVEESNRRLEFGSVKTQVTAVAQALAVDLIVVGAHGRHGLAQLMGSNASAIVNTVECDVFVVHL